MGVDVDTLNEMLAKVDGETNTHWNISAIGGTDDRTWN